jgi:hypothetical protein
MEPPESEDSSGSTLFLHLRARRRKGDLLAGRLALEHPAGNPPAPPLSRCQAFSLDLGSRVRECDLNRFRIPKRVVGRPPKGSSLPPDRLVWACRRPPGPQQASDSFLGEPPT